MSQIWIDRTLYPGRPQSADGRLEKEIRTYDLLDSLQIPYLRLDHEAADTIGDCQDVDHLLGIHICKNLFLCNAQKTQFYLLMMPGEKKFRTAVFSKLMGCSRLSFADSAHMSELLGITPGSVSVLGLMNDAENRVQLAIDAEVLDSEYIGCHPCINTSSLKIRTEDLIHKILPFIHHTYTLVQL